jgi:hypothetical protein
MTSYILDTPGVSAYGNRPSFGVDFWMQSYVSINNILITVSNREITSITATFSGSATWSGWNSNISNSDNNSITINGGSNLLPNASITGTLTTTPVSIPITSIGIQITVYGSHHHYADAGTSASGHTTDASVTKTYTVNFSSDFNFVDTSTYKVILLSETDGQLIFIKDKNGNAASYNIVVSPANGSLIDGSQTFTINNNFGCLSLFSNATNWNIANYYTGDIRTDITVSQYKEINLSPNTLNITSANSTGGSSDVSSTLPGGSSGQMIPLIVTAPINCKVLFDSPLIVETPNVFPYITPFTAGTQISIGCLLISDGENWYIAGQFNDTNWIVTSSPSGLGTALQIPQSLLNVSSNNNYYVLPAFSGTDGLLTIHKHTGVIPVLTYSTNNTYLQHTIQTTNSCVWFMTYNNISYPMLAYTPN